MSERDFSREKRFGRGENSLKNFGKEKNYKKKSLGKRRRKKIRKRMRRFFLREQFYKKGISKKFGKKMFEGKESLHKMEKERKF